MTRATESQLDVGRLGVHVRAVGEGEPLLLINGIGTHTAMWEPVERALDGFRIIEFDLPGAGQSSVPWKPLSVSRYARVAESVLDHFGVADAHVLGYSMGGIIAQQLAADSPERIRRLVLVATSPGIGSVYGDRKAMLNISTPLRYRSPALYRMSIASMVGGRARNDPEWVVEQGTLRTQLAPSWRGYLGQLFSITGWSGLRLLPGVERPTLVVMGDDDPLTPVANGMLLAHLLPQGRLLLFGGEGHLLLLDSKSRCHAAIHDFLTAEPLEASEAWRAAKEIDYETLESVLDGTTWKMPPWSLFSTAVRRRRLSPPGRESASTAGDAGLVKK